jgi:hypothetical protein
MSKHNNNNNINQNKKLTGLNFFAKNINQITLIKKMKMSKKN